MNDKDRQNRYGRLLNLFMLKDYERAEQLAEELKGEFSEDYRFAMLLGNIYTMGEKNRDAIASFRHTLDLNPRCTEAYNNLGLIYRKLGRFEKAAAALEKALKLDGDNPDVLYNLGNLHKAMGNGVMAIEAYRKVLAQKPEYLQAYNNLGAIYEGRDEIALARKTYEEGLKIDPSNSSLLYNLGVLYQKEELWDEAERCFRDALKKRPGWIDCQNNLAITLQEQDRLGEARQLLYSILEKDSSQASIHNNLGVVQSRMGHLEEAQKAYGAALALDRDYKKASLNLNRVYKTQKNYTESLKELNRLVTVYPYDMEIRNELGESLIRLNQLNQGEQTFKHIIQRDPDNIQARKNLAELYLRQGDEAKAENQIRRIGSALYEDEEAVLRITDAYRKNSNNERAEKILRDLCSFRPDSLKARESLSRSLDSLGRPREALDLLEELDREDPDNPERLGDLVKLYRETDRKMDALARLDQLMNIHGGRGTSDDLDRMKEVLDLYENTADDLYRENRKEWEGRVDRLVKRVKSTLPVAPKQGEKDDLLSADSFASRSLVEQDALSLLDMAMIDPVITINEPEETLYLEDSPEDFSEVYTEVMKEEERRRKEEAAQAAAHPPSGYPPPIIINMPPLPPAPQEQPPHEEEEVLEYTLEEEPEILPEGEELPPPPPEPQEIPEPAPPPGEPPREEGVDRKALIDMLDYIYDLTDNLPQEKKEMMIRDDMPLKLECVRSKLEGDRSLMEVAGRYDRRQRDRSHIVVSDEKLENSLGFLQKLSHEYPDIKVSESFDAKLGRILNRIREIKSPHPPEGN